MSYPRQAATIVDTIGSLRSEPGPPLERYRITLDTGALYKFAVGSSLPDDGVNVIVAGGGGTLGAWVLVARSDISSAVTVTHASPSTALAISQTAFVDVSGGAPPTLTMPASPPFGRPVSVINSAGSFAITPCTVTANAGWTIEDPGAPLTFGATATLTVAGCAVTWIADVPNTRWKVV